jgi:hypothetical protein
MTSDEVMSLEEQGWAALASDAATAVAFYDGVLDDEAVMLLPGGLVIEDRQMILKSMSGQPWSSYSLADWRVIQPTGDTAVVTYSVVAQRAGSEPYSALMSSLYVRRADRWKLVFHQQTPR